jgi:oligopeptide transport system permease protein
MIKFLFRRLAMALVTLLLIACMTFLLMNLVPGGPFLSEKAPSPEVLAAMEAKYGLDKPLVVRMATWIGDFAQGDLGVSFRLQKNRPVADIIMDLFPTSLKIGMIALLIAVLLGIPLGALAAYYRGHWLDSLLQVITTLGIAIPSFVLASIFLVIFGVYFNVLPTLGLSSWESYILPCFALAFYPMSYVARLTRSSMLDVIHQEYIRTARAKGVSPTKIVFKHALRNSIIPVITYLGPLTAGIVTGSFVVESVFNIPGLGRYYIQSILGRDYPLIMATTVLYAGLLIFMNLLVDVVYKFVDPRIDVTGEVEK